MVNEPVNFLWARLFVCVDVCLVCLMCSPMVVPPTFWVLLFYHLAFRDMETWSFYKPLIPVILTTWRLPWRWRQRVPSKHTKRIYRLYGFTLQRT